MYPAPTYDPGRLNLHRSKTHSMPVEISRVIKKSVEEYGPSNPDQIALSKSIWRLPA